MSTLTPRARRRRLALPPREQRMAGLRVLMVMVALLWAVEIFNTADGNALDGDGIIARNAGRLWGILTAPLIHASFAHLIANTIPLAFTGAIIALRGARPLLRLTAVVVLLGGLGTWLIAPANVSTIGASGLVFGFSAYLIVRGAFTRRLTELITGAFVAVVLGGALTSSLVPSYGVSWQGHLCGGIAGVVAAWVMSGRPGRRPRSPVP